MREEVREEGGRKGRASALSSITVADAPEQVVQLRHVLRQRVGRHRRQVGLHRRAAGQPAVGRVDVTLRRPARVRVHSHPDIIYIYNIFTYI